jgi:RNA polymerase sigma-70 factor (ECF subfamily)
VSTLSAAAGPPVAAQDQADVALAAAGDTAAFERIYRRHAGRIHALVRRMMGPAEADDVTQEIFVRTWRKLDQFRGDAAFATWLHRLAVNVILARRHRAVKHHERFGAEEPPPGRRPGRRDATALRMDLEAAVARLPEGARQIFVLHDVEGYTHEEIGGLLDLAPGTSKSQLHRARMMLRAYLK